jgi:hypothetical protein
MASCVAYSGTSRLKTSGLALAHASASISSPAMPTLAGPKTADDAGVSRGRKGKTLTGRQEGPEGMKWGKQRVPQRVAVLKTPEENNWPKQIGQKKLAQKNWVPHQRRVHPEGLCL